MNYLIIEEDASVTQTDVISDDNMDDCVPGFIRIIRVNNGVFQELTPIDPSDTNNWTDVSRN